MSARNTPDPYRELPARLAPWVLRVHHLVERKTADAAAHAGRAISERARLARDGRPTARIVTASPSHRAALARIEELRRALVGGKGSLKGLIRDARAAFLADAYHIWGGPTGQSGARPSQAALNVARAAILHGYTLEAEVAGSFEAAARSLEAACNLAARRGTAERAAGDLLTAWRERTSAMIERVCITTLEDSQWAFFWSAQYVLVNRS